MSYFRDFLLSLSHNTNPPSRQVKRRVFYSNIRSNIYNSNRLNKNINNYTKSFRNNYRSSQKKEEKSEKEWSKGRASFKKNCHKVNESPFRVKSLNVGSMRGKTSEVVETMSKRRVDLCCLQETRWKTNLKLIAGRDSRYKYYGCGNYEGTCGVGILLAEKWWEKVFKVIRVSDRIIFIRMVVGSVVFVFMSVYALQANLSESVKGQFYYALQSTIARVSSLEQLIICRDWNGHIGSHSTAFEDMHGGQALGKRNHEGERLQKFAVSNELVVSNSWFKKKFEHLVTYQSGDCKTQIDYILYKRSFRKMVSNVNIIAGEECATQHRLVVGDFKVCTHVHPKKSFVSRTKVWKLRLWKSS